MVEKKMAVDLTEQDSAIIILSLELRGMYFVPHSLRDKKRLPDLKKELTDKHHEVFVEPRVVRRKK